MFRGLYTSGASLITNNKKVDIITNNMANINTAGYKKDLVLTEAFEDVMVSKINGTTPYVDTKKFQGIEVENQDGAYKLSAKVGYFKVDTPAGVSYNSGLNLAVGEDGYLKTFHKDQRGNIDTTYGHKVVGKKGPIKIEGKEFEVDESGNVLVGGEVVDSLITVPHPRVIGTLSSGIKLERIETNYTQGQLMGTDNPLDFAIQGEGFFQVETPSGIKLTRNGSFKLSGEGVLVTSEGYEVQGFDGPILVEGSELAVNTFGEILVDGEVVDKFKLINVENLNDLRKIGDGLIEMEKGIEIEEIDFTGEVLQGHLENSNVDSIKEMIEMITLFRGYESNQKVVRAYDESIGRAVNDIGAL